MHILIAPNAFKNSLSAVQAANAIQQGLNRSRLKGTNECFPVGDGGDGTAGLLVDRLGGHMVEAEARDPFGKIISTWWGLADNGRTAIIEMANASGLRLLRQGELNPLAASSRGTGDLIRAALDYFPAAPDHSQPARHDNSKPIRDANADHPVSRIILCMGGSATVDGGTGILEALGARFINREGQPLTALPAGLADLASIDISGLHPRLAQVGITVLCDVNNPFTGREGAAAVFGPQKGASQEDVQHLETALLRLAQVIYRQTGKEISNHPRAGTAGGAAGGLYGLLSARLVNGIDYFLEVSGFDKALSRSDYVLTGEGSIDEQTLQGKGPSGVATRAKKKGLPVIGLAGSVPPVLSQTMRQFFDVLLPIGSRPLELAEALRHTASDLSRTAEQLGNLLAMQG